MNREARAGLIATIVVVIFGWGMSMATSTQRQKEFGTAYHIIFNRVEGLEEGCKVYYSGRLVGRVRRIEVFRQQDEPDRVDVTIAISPFYSGDVKLSRESTYSVEGGIWGERWININYEPGNPIPAGGMVYGVSVPRLSHVLRHGVSMMDEVQDLVKSYDVKLGDVDKTSRKLKKTVQYYNDAAFEMRVQANRFNKVVGMMNDRMDHMVKAVEQRIISARNRSAIMSAQMRMYARTLEATAVRQDNSLHGMLVSVSRRMQVAAAPIQAFQKAILAWQEPMREAVSTARHKVEELRDIAETLRFISHNPKLKEQFLKLTGDLRSRVAAMRKMLKNPAGVLGGGKKPPSPSPAPEASPSPVTQPEPAPTTVPSAAPTPSETPSEPTGSSSAGAARPPRPTLPSPTPETH